MYGLPGKGKGEALGQVYLVNVSLADIVPDAPDGRQVSLPGKVAGERPHLVRSQGLGRSPPGNGLICPPGTPSPGVFVDYPDFPELAAPAVVHHQTPGKGHHQVRKIQIIRRGLGQYLQMVFQVVGQKPQAPGGQGVRGVSPGSSRAAQASSRTLKGLPRHTWLDLEPRRLT